MFPADDSNSFTVPYSDQFLLYSTLVDNNADHIVDYSNHTNTYSPYFSFYDQNMAAHSLSDIDQQIDLIQSSPLVDQHHEEEEEEPIMLTAFEEFTVSSDITSGGNHRTDPTNNGIISSTTSAAVGGMKKKKIYDKQVSNKNVNNLSKKDRHSKINTAQGPRDRRMRLSLDIAKRFFGLQDMLGFDKASKTVDWLLSKSQLEINKVATKSSSTTTDSFGTNYDHQCTACEEVSEVVSQSGDMDTTNYMMNKKSNIAKKTRKKRPSMEKVISSVVSLRNINGLNNNNNHIGNNKESREKARARARERTKEKMMMMLYCTDQINVASSSTSLAIRRSMDHQINMRNQILQGPPRVNYDSFVDDDQLHSSMTTNQQYNSPANTTTCLQWNNLNQQMISGSTNSHQLPFEDLQFYGKPWENYN